jgi:VanZ family protein
LSENYYDENEIEIMHNKERLLLFLYLMILFLGATLPINGTDSALNNNYLLNIRWDYLLHALIYIPLYPLLLLSQRNKSKTKINLILLTLSIIIAISLEAIQYIIPWRAFNVNDMVGNVVGVGIGIITITIF